MEVSSGGHCELDDSAFGNLVKRLSCVQCRCLFHAGPRQPRSLRCLHSICESCAEGILKDSADVICKLCQTRTVVAGSNVDALQLNEDLRDLALFLTPANGQRTDEAVRSVLSNIREDVEKGAFLRRPPNVDAVVSKGASAAGASWAVVPHAAKKDRFSRINNEMSVTPFPHPDFPEGVGGSVLSVVPGIAFNTRMRQAGLSEDVKIPRPAPGRDHGKERLDSNNRQVTSSRGVGGERDVPSFPAHSLQGTVSETQWKFYSDEDDRRRGQDVGLSSKPKGAQGRVEHRRREHCSRQSSRERQRRSSDSSGRDDSNEDSVIVGAGRRTRGKGAAAAADERQESRDSALESSSSGKNFLGQTDVRKNKRAAQVNEMNPVLHSFAFVDQLNASLVAHGAACPVCEEKLSDPSPFKDGHLDTMAVVRLVACGQRLHHHCAVRMRKGGSPTYFECPKCEKIHGVIFGRQPAGGKMRMNRVPTSQFACAYEPLAGFPNTDTIVIRYEFDGGIQDVDDPNPGKPYTADKFPRHAHLPMTQHGYKVLCMLKIAFDRRLIFKVGTSAHTGKTDCLVWAGIPHKTSPHPGTYGYPDPTYLDEVTKQLEAVGITPVDIPDDPVRDLGIPFDSTPSYSTAL